LQENWHGTCKKRTPPPDTRPRWKADGFKSAEAWVEEHAKPRLHRATPAERDKILAEVRAEALVPWGSKPTLPLAPDKRQPLTNTDAVFTGARSTGPFGEEMDRDYPPKQQEAPDGR
jgi:hypothetical protein